MRHHMIFSRREEFYDNALSYMNLLPLYFERKNLGTIEREAESKQGRKFNICIFMLFTRERKEMGE